jgi:hypothetical protein
MPSASCVRWIARLLRSGVSLCLLSAGIFTQPSLGADTPAAAQVFLASEWRGGSDMAFEGCAANSGEYTLWVYARGEKCGVPREQADRVVIFRQPLPGVSPLRATSRLPAGAYAVWAFGRGDPGHPWINLCAKTCVKGALPAEPGWVGLGSIEVRDLHQMWLKSWGQPDGHQLYIQAIVLTTSESEPAWRP